MDMDNSNTISNFTTKNRVTTATRTVCVHINTIQQQEKEVLVMMCMGFQAMKGHLHPREE